MEKAGRPRIAIVDDDPHLRALLVAGLEPEGFAVRVAGDGDAGIALVRAWLPDAIVLDIVLSLMDGLETMAALRRFTCATASPGSTPAGTTIS